MNLLDRIRGTFTARTHHTEDELVYLNRHERRARGIRTPVGLVPEGLVVQQATQVPRYVRRKIAAFQSKLRTRRNRKVKAKVRRLMVGRL